MDSLQHTATGEPISTMAHPDSIVTIRARLERVDREQDKYIAALLERTRRKVSAVLTPDTPVAPVWLNVEQGAIPRRRSILAGLADLRNAGERRKMTKKRAA